MKSKEYNLFEDIELTDEERKYFEEQDRISDLIIKLIDKRVKLNLTQRDLAEKTGIKQPMIARIENFSCDPRISTLVKLATALDLKIMPVEQEQKIEQKISIVYVVKSSEKRDYSIGNNTLFGNGIWSSNTSYCHVN